MEWISVKDRLPNSLQYVLVTDGINFHVASFSFVCQWFEFGDAIWWDNEDVTHWMPLPSPPEKI